MPRVNADGFVARYVTSQDGLSLYVRDYPGPEPASRLPVLCLHGLTRNSKDFAGFAKFHGRRRRVLCLDIRGRGRSEYDPNTDNYRPETYVNDIRHVLTALNLHGVVVLGTSMGGILGMAMAAAMPTVLKGLVLNDVGPRVRRTNLDKIMNYMMSDPHFETWEDAGRHLEAAFASQIPLSGRDAWTLAARNSYVEGADGRIVFDWDPDIAKALLKDKTEIYDLWHLFEATKQVPVLTIRGAKSDILPQAQLDEMSARHPRMTSVVVPGIGHAPTLAEPEAMESLNGFLEQF